MRVGVEENCRRIAAYINEYTEANGASPTVRQIAAGLGISKSLVGQYLKQMKENGVLQYEGHRNITTEKGRKTKKETLIVPILGTISCGIPKYAEENIEEYVLLPIALIGRGKFFLLHASGDSMIDVNIDDGDLVLIRQQDYADAGQIVVALIEDEATLKRYYPEPQNHRIRLHPENKQLSDIYVDNCIIQGVAVKVLKDLL